MISEEEIKKITEVVENIPNGEVLSTPEPGDRLLYEVYDLYGKEEEFQREILGYRDLIKNVVPNTHLVLVFYNRGSAWNGRDMVPTNLIAHISIIPFSIRKWGHENDF